MTIAPTVGPVQRPGDDRDLTEIFQRVGDLERYPPGRWIYAGTYPGDPLTTPDSPVFQNGISGFLRFRVTREKDLQVEADIVGMSPGDVVTNVAAFYRPPQDGYGVGKYGDDAAPGVSVWKVATNGDIVYVGAVVGGVEGAIHWGTNTDDDALGLILSVFQSVLFDTNGFPFEVDSSTFKIVASDIVSVALAIGKAVKILDSGANPIFQVDENGAFQVNAGGGAMLFDSAGNFQVNIPVGQAVSFWDNTFSVERFAVDEDGKVRARLGAGQPFTLLDSAGSPMLQMTEGSPDLHIPAGGNVVADL